MVGANKGHGGGFGDSLGAAARETIAAGVLIFEDSTKTDAEVVHGLRRTLKRWRALLRLLADPLGDISKHLRTEARDLMRGLAHARDAQSALDALKDLRRSDTLAPPSLATIEERLNDIKRKAEASAMTDAMRERIRRYFDYAALSIDRWPLQQIKFSTVAGGLSSTYRRARSLIPEDWAAADAEELHTLRRRVVEHRHQMDVIEPLWPRLGEVWAREAQRLRNRLGACQDLAVLEGLTAPHQPLAHWRSRLAPVIAARKAAHITASARLAGRLFAEKSKAFQHRVEALWTSGKDVPEIDLAGTAHTAPARKSKPAKKTPRRRKTRPGKSGRVKKALRARKPMRARKIIHVKRIRKPVRRKKVRKPRKQRRAGKPRRVIKRRTRK